MQKWDPGNRDGCHPRYCAARSVARLPPSLASAQLTCSVAPRDCHCRSWVRPDGADAPRCRYKIPMVCKPAQQARVPPAARCSCHGPYTASLCARTVRLARASMALKRGKPPRLRRPATRSRRLSVSSLSCTRTASAFYRHSVEFATLCKCGLTNYRAHTSTVPHHAIAQVVVHNLSFMHASLLVVWDRM